MNEEASRHIVCAVRGKPESRQTVHHAIDLALEQAARLTFLHVIDAEFVQHATVGPLSVVYRQLIEMGEFVMLILVDRAKRRGVSQVDYVLREGDLRQQVRNYLEETRPDVIVVGVPESRQKGGIFSLKEFQEFITELEGDLNLSVIQVNH
ncbi:MAG: universal stress protein [Anaerolineales bacterium]|jgi:nucleotide-binding universal stress UspA family protein